METYEGLCGIFCLVFGIAGIIIYVLYQCEKETVEELESQVNSYAAQLHAEKDISNNLEKEIVKLREENLALRQNKSKEKVKRFLGEINERIIHEHEFYV